MAVDFKKTLKHLYAPKTKLSVVNVENANYIAVRGVGLLMIKEFVSNVCLLSFKKKI